MPNENKNATVDLEELDAESFDYDALEKELEADLGDLQGLKEDELKIGNPDALGDAVTAVIWDQFLNQVGAVAGEDFIKENRGMTLDLRNEAHIQTTENFAEGKIASHNTEIDYQQRYDDWQSNFVKDENGKIVMHDTRVPERDSKGNIVYDNNGKAIKKKAETLVKDYRKPFDDVRNERGLKGNKEKGTAMDETIAVATIVRDPAANAHMTKEEQIEFDLSEKNLNEINSKWNSSKGDNPTDEWLDNPNANGQKPSEIFDDLDEKSEKQLKEKYEEAKEEYDKKKKEGEEKSISAGKKSQKAEAFRIGGKALRAAVMGLLAELGRTIIQKLISWIKSGAKNIKTFIQYVKDAITSFVTNLKQNILTAGSTVATTIITAIFGPVASMINRVIMFVKQGVRSLKEAIQYIRNPENRKKPFSVMMLEVGKIIIAGMTAAGAIVLGEVIEAGLTTIPGFGVEIPLIGSLANIIGIFLGAVVAGIAGAFAIHLIDKIVSDKLKAENKKQQIEKANKALEVQGKQIVIAKNRLEETKSEAATSIKERHEAAAEEIRSSVGHIMSAKKVDNEETLRNINDMLDNL